MLCGKFHYFYFAPFLNLTKHTEHSNSQLFLMHEAFSFHDEMYDAIEITPMEVDGKVEVLSSDGIPADLSTHGEDVINDGCDYPTDLSLYGQDVINDGCDDDDDRCDDPADHSCLHNSCDDSHDENVDFDLHRYRQMPTSPSTWLLEFIMNHEDCLSSFQTSPISIDHPVA